MAGRVPNEDSRCGQSPGKRFRECASLVGMLCGAVACEEKTEPALSVEQGAHVEGDFDTPDLGVISAESPRLGAIVDRAPIYSAAHQKAPIIGYLHAGDQVSRSDKAHENDQCTEGWYAVAPRGYVCTEKSTTIDLEHPTLRAMALRANVEGLLPYTYASTTSVTALFNKKEGDGDEGVELKGRLAKSTAMAIVGSWTAPDESNEPQRLALKMDGRFVRADDLVAANGSDFEGAQLSESLELPLAYVVRNGVRAWGMDGAAAVKRDELDYHSRLELTGRFRTVQGNRFWAVKDGRWVRHEDVTVLRKRHEFPDFATGEQKWIDVSIVTGSAIAYEGQKPVYATLVSVGRDRQGDPKTTASTATGTFRVVRKQITQRTLDSPDAQLHDAPWALELESGDWLHASPSHDRFGIEHTDGNIEVSPRDGRALFFWSTPGLPVGWHGLVVEPSAETTIVHVR
jgi:L,D-transpeptidase catalytic domain